MKDYLKDFVLEEMKEYTDAAYADYGSARDQLERLVFKVEQATLERAAKHFADHNYGEFYRDEIASELRALKDSND